MLSAEYLRKLEMQLLEYQLLEALTAEYGDGQCRIIPFPQPPEYDRAA